MAEPVTRRPIAARGLPLSRWAAGQLVRRQVRASAISFAGLACAVAAGVLVSAK